MSNLELMESILAFWKKDNTFKRSIEEKSSALQYRFFDGPPFASGTPHYWHLLAWSIKDVLPRYMAMRGYQVKRKRGRDCHGLPVEKAVEKALGIDGKKDIEEKIWIETFVEKCRAYVNQTNADWHWFVDHTGRWADIENPYFTMDLDFMESVMYCFSSIYRQNKVYKGFKVQGYCPSCATPLANNEISEGYEDRQDTAITVKFSLFNKNAAGYETSEDGFVDVVAGVLKNEDGAYAMVHHAKENLRFFPGGKVEAGESLISALKREIKEEVGVDVEEKAYLGAVKIVHLGKPYRVHRFELTTEGTPTIQEQDKHNALVWVKEEKSENALGFCLNIAGNIIDDEKELTHDFIDFHLFRNVLDPQEKGLIEWNFNFLAWTTTPWTLPSNVYLAIGEDIDYITVYDPTSQEYFVMAEKLLKKYFKSPDQYRFIYRQKGKELKNLTYQPLFPYVQNSQIDAQYKDQFFQLLSGDFVTTEDGTGIVHIAPSFGEVDFWAVAEKLGWEFARDWIFMPVDEYGTFTDLVPDFAGMKVMDSNKTIIEQLKSAGKLVKAESINHSYPHCRRCKTPLIYKAMSSRFIKEKEMNAQTWSDAEQINFTPASVKNRFVNGLASAPDWNVARNRYRGSPLPIWENVADPEDRMSIANLDELFHLTKTGSKNLTKNIFIRHGRTNFNDEKKVDALGASVLTELGQEQSQNLVAKLEHLKAEKSELIFVLSPLQRTRQTIKPTLLSRFSESEVSSRESQYYALWEQYRAAFADRSLQERLQGADEQVVFQLGEQIFVDWRLTDHLSFADQATVRPCDLLNRKDPSKPIGIDGETITQNSSRVKNALKYWNNKAKSQNLVFVSHADTIGLARQAFRNFDYAKQRKIFLPKNAEIKVHYWDNDRNAEVDLHKPYVDNYRGIQNGKTYKRTSEVLDCWFESGSMPFGQDHYLGEADHNISYPADFIAEGLDQTRGWFRSLHVVGHAIKGQNAFKNVVVNGLVLAEDGKKMSKSLKNYPDPRMLIEKRGADAFRLYTLSSPVVRSEPMRFAERGVEQAFKDFNIPLENVYKFFETYAKIDGWKPSGTELFLASEKSNLDLETLARVSPDIIITSDLAHGKANTYAESLEQYCNKKPKILMINEVSDQYFDLLSQNEGQTILLLTSEWEVNKIWLKTYGLEKNITLQDSEILKLPTYQITSDLDKWILAELHKTLANVDEGLRAYAIDAAIKSWTDFIEKLSNRYLRRSRRRFRENGLSADKISAYATIYEVLTTYLKMMAPFTPFVTEHIWIQLQEFSDKKSESIHLQSWPFASVHYIDEQLMQEIALVRKTIKLALFIRSKNKIAVKQPLQRLELNIEN